MIEHIYTRMRRRSAKLLKKDDFKMLSERSPIEIVEFLKGRSRFYNLYAQEYALFYPSEELLGVMSKGRYLAPLLEFEKYSETLFDTKAEILLDMYLYFFKSKILMTLLSGLYSNKSFEEVKSVIITTPSINDLLEYHYMNKHVYELSFLLLENKSLSLEIFEAFKKEDFEGFSKAILVEGIRRLEKTYELFRNLNEKFVVKYVMYLMGDVLYRLNTLGLDLSLDSFKVCKIKRDPRGVSKILKHVLPKNGYNHSEINEEILEQVQKRFYKESEKVFSLKPFTYDAILGYVLMLEREFRAVNILARYKLYENMLSKDEFDKAIGELYD